MKKFTYSVVAAMAMSTFAIAGGDIAPVEEPMVEVEPVITDAGLYLGLGYSFFKSDSKFFDFSHTSRDIDLAFDDDYSAIMLQAGYKINSYVAVEGRYWAGITDNEFDLFGDTINSEANAWGIYVKPMYPVTDAIDIYALLGYASVNVDTSDLIGDMDLDGFSWGLGVAYSFTDSISIFVDYTDFQDDDIAVTRKHDTLGDIDATFNHAFDSINLGVTYQF